MARLNESKGEVYNYHFFLTKLFEFGAAPRHNVLVVSGLSSEPGCSESSSGDVRENGRA